MKEQMLRNLTESELLSEADRSDNPLVKAFAERVKRGIQRENGRFEYSEAQIESLEEEVADLETQIRELEKEAEKREEEIKDLKSQIEELEK